MAWRLLPDLFQQTITVNGLPAVGYVLKAYLFNTTTPAALATDSAGAGQATSFTLNSRGAPQSAGGTEVSLFGDTALSAGYKIVLEDESGAVIRTYAGPIFPVPGALGDFGIGLTSAISHTPHSGIEQLLSAYLDSQLATAPEDYASITSGVTDATTAINTALGASLNVRLIPGKIYLISSSLSVRSNAMFNINGATIRRMTGSGVFDMIVNSDSVGGNTNIAITNAIIDGNKDANGLVKANASDRFCGIRLRNCTDSFVGNAHVENTVNAEMQAEGNRAAIIFEDCDKCGAERIRVNDNDGSGFFFCNTTDSYLNGLVGADNLGSTMTSYGADDCRYFNVRSENSSYSGISISGLRSIADGLYASGAAAGYSGVNIGHDATGNRSNGSVVSNITIKDCVNWGFFVAGSEYVRITNLTIENCNTSSLAANNNESARIFTSNYISLNQGSIKNSSYSVSRGIRFSGGVGHRIDNFDIHDNAYTGIDVDLNAEVSFGPGMRCFNNGKITSANSAGLVVGSGSYATIRGGQYYDDQGTKTQESGVWAGGSAGVYLDGAYIPVNKTNALRKTSSPVMLLEKYRLGSVAMQGTFTATAAAATLVVNNNNARDPAMVRITPRNAAAVALGVPFVSSAVAGTSFTVTFPAPAVGTENFAYELF